MALVTMGSTSRSLPADTNHRQDAKPDSDGRKEQCDICQALQWRPSVGDRFPFVIHWAIPVCLG
ncbi:hypothetical protein, partial [Aminobacter sp. LjRoot7]|uniref:hypothetical protein n=1 Tax=Aminobacter sp. LjRoot7 TaxID=3342335 RepID=UPI003F506C58